MNILTITIYCNLTKDISLAFWQKSTRRYLRWTVTTNTRISYSSCHNDSKIQLCASTEHLFILMRSRHPLPPSQKSDGLLVNVLLQVVHACSAE